MNFISFQCDNKEKFTVFGIANKICKKPIVLRFMYSSYQELDGQNPAIVDIPPVRYIQFHPKTWHSEICMRVQLYKEQSGVLTGRFFSKHHYFKLSPSRLLKFRTGEKS